MKKKIKIILISTRLTSNCLVFITNINIVMFLTKPNLYANFELPMTSLNMT